MGQDQRLVGWVQGSTEGPLLLCIGGLHGNEGAGVDALESVTRKLEQRRDALRGDFVAVRGNVQALADERRFIHYDLNRAWESRRVEAVAAGGGTAGFGAAEARAEDAEVDGLGSLLERVRSESRGHLYVLDLHTTSGGGGPFTTVGDTLDNREFASAIPVPLVLGLEELVEGTLVGYLSEQGYTTAVFESGQHSEPEARVRAEWAIWIAVRAAGLLAPDDVPEAQRGYDALAAESQSLPRVLEMQYRHQVDAADGYRTLPGLANFQVVTQGDVLAEDRRGEVRSPRSGRILMPLYQEQGEDGFFIVREFSRIWLWVSRSLRRLGVARIVHWLPGVYRDPSLPGALVANRTVARWFALELFHLLGYRRHLEEQNRLVVVRRRMHLSDSGRP